MGGTTGLSGLTGDGSRTVSFSGNVADINTALIGLEYQGTLNYADNDTLTFFVDDQVGGTSTATKAITVLPVNDDAPIDLITSVLLI